MGGVDLWQNEDETYDNFDPQSMHDKILEVVSISGTWHLGKLQVFGYLWMLYLLICDTHTYILECCFLLVDFSRILGYVVLA